MSYKCTNCKHEFDKPISKSLHLKYTRYDDTKIKVCPRCGSTSFELVLEPSVPSEPPRFFYKIRRKSDGKFSTGGGSPNWTAGGKTWNEIHHLRAHLRDGGFLGGRGLGWCDPRVYRNAEVIKFELKIVESYPVLDEIDSLRVRAVELEKERAEAAAKSELTRAKRRLEEAKRILREAGELD